MVIERFWRSSEVFSRSEVASNANKVGKALVVTVEIGLLSISNQTQQQMQKNDAYSLRTSLKSVVAFFGVCTIVSPTFNAALPVKMPT